MKLMKFYIYISLFFPSLFSKFLFFFKLRLEFHFIPSKINKYEFCCLIDPTNLIQRYMDFYQVKKKDFRLKIIIGQLKKLQYSFRDFRFNGHLIIFSKTSKAIRLSIHHRKRWPPLAQLVIFFLFFFFSSSAFLHSGCSFAVCMRNGRLINGYSLFIIIILKHVNTD